MADAHADSSPEHRQHQLFPPDAVTPNAPHRRNRDAAGESSSAGNGSGSSSLRVTPDLTRDSLTTHHATLDGGPAAETLRPDDTIRRRRSHRPNASFLLQDGGVKPSHGSRLPGRTAASHARAANDDSHLDTPESVQSISLQNKAMRVVSDPLTGNAPTRLSPELVNKLSTGSLDRSSPASSQNSRSAGGGPAPVDADSSQIVSMALNLSESRRLAARRNVSRGTPPKLMPLPDSPTTNDLRLQLKQQRRSSSNLSPRLGQSLLPRQSTGLSMSSPLHSTFHAGLDDSYRYHFSPSTLARAQKAKDQLELMAQYRRLLDVLPPLKPTHLRVITVSPPGSPTGAAKVFTWSSAPNPVQLGRKYNPLQYIRNRKVRARERKVIDGERLGFAEVDSVKSWVEKCEQNVALQQPEDDAECMVPFPGAQEPAAHSTPDQAAKAARARRPRVDWFIEPCDMIADAYWIEQDQNKELVEDRLWRRIFPPNPDLLRPMSRETEESKHGIAPFSPDNGNSLSGPKHIKNAQVFHNPEHGHHNAIERAREKLHSMTDPNHWQIPEHLHSRPRSKKDSASEYSESDNEAQNRTVRDNRRRPSTKSAQPSDVLHRQMLEIIAKENRDKDISEITGVERFVPPSMASPERNVRSNPSSQLQSRRDSFIDTSDNERKGAFDRIQKISPSHVRPEQQNPDDPVLRAPRSVDNDSSLPTSPELRPSRKTTLESATMERPTLWSRSGSPSKNQAAKSRLSPETKYLADKEHPASDRFQDAPQGVRQETGSHALSLDTEQSLARNVSAPLAGDTIKGHRRSGSIRHRAEDPNSGILGIFKAPRIDTVLRGGVTRIGGILRKKDGSGESQEIDSTDESDGERARGRRRLSMSLSRRPSNKEKRKIQEPKHFLDVMPQFRHAPGASAENDMQKSASWAGQAMQSSESSRVDLPRPPHTGLRSSSMSASPPPNAVGRLGESDMSEPESIRGRVPARVRETDRRLNVVLGDGTVRRSERRERAKSRQWSIVDQDGRQVEQGPLSRREVARMKTLVLSSGIKAMEITRRAQEMHKPFGDNHDAKTSLKCANIDWDGIARLCPENKHFKDQEAPFAELYPLAAQTLANNIQIFGQRWQISADKFTSVTGPELQRRVGGVRSRVGDDLARMTRSAADEADEASRSLALDQPLRIKHVVDMMEKMLRKRRRRLRWVRRGLWLSVEWLVVGFMWYVWFVVMILRVFLGIGKGIWNGIKWVLWLS